MERFHYTIKQKLQILDLVRNNQVSRLASLFPRITQKQIDEWHENEERMRALPEETQNTKCTLHPGPDQQYKELYQFLYQKVKALRLEKKAVTVDLLISFAEEEETKFKELTYDGKKSLIRRFMQYFQMSIRQITGNTGSTEEQMSEDQREIIEAFKREYRRLIQINNIPPENIFNMDQTGIFYENLATRTIEPSGSRDVYVQANGDDKKRITLFSLMDALGQLHTQLVVYKGKRDGRIHQEVQEYDDWLSYHTVQENAWCDGLVLVEWIWRIWQPLISRRSGTKLLILDSYPLHKDLEASFGKNSTYVLYIPKGLTWKLQPLDCGYFKVLKDEMKKIWIKNQQTMYDNEKQKRKALSENLKEIIYSQFDNNYSPFWQKAGLEYPHDDLLMRVIPQESMEEELNCNEGVENSSIMIIEEENYSNLFSDNN